MFQIMKQNFSDVNLPFYHFKGAVCKNLPAVTFSTTTYKVASWLACYMSRYLSNTLSNCL